MKIIDRTPFVDEYGGMSFSDRIKAGMQFGFGWMKELKAQQALVARLKRTLSDRFTLLMNTTLPDLEVPVPIILIGPPGITIIYVTPLRGVYRARGDQWLEVTADRQNRRAKPNLITRTALFAGAIRVFVEKNNFQSLPVEGVLVCSDPGMYVESTRPVTRVVLSDAIDMFINGFNQTQAVVSYETTSQLVQAITTPAAPSAELAAAPSAKARPAATASANKLSSRQWIVLGVMAALLVCALIAFLVLLVIYA